MHDRHGVPTLECRACKHWRPLTEYSRSARGYYQSYCKPCNSARAHEWRYGHRERVQRRGEQIVAFIRALRCRGTRLQIRTRVVATFGVSEKNAYRYIQMAEASP